jgi:hypothetical protein
MSGPVAAAWWDPPVRDARGYELRPNPAGAATMAELTRLLRMYRAWAGDPSLAELARHVHQRVTAATMSRALSGARPLTRPVLVTILEAIGGEQAYRDAFARSWDRLAFEERYAARSGVSVRWLHWAGRWAEPCDGGEDGCGGWAMGHQHEEALAMNEARGDAAP